MENKLTGQTVGYHKLPDGQYILTVLEYNPESGEGKVIESTPVGDHSALAVDAFKKKALDLGLVK